ncbi:hypothetical protein SAY87_014550 [Trapa incisa]|uniref:CRC domain-containing protein n=1 Tax=Trapa incisa TaxID=236973 RepID=A0AAN7GST4_9MYRT|nr:hypothetical protein SAY87_014550 [Trapa incisa]
MDTSKPFFLELREMEEGLTAYIHSRMANNAFLARGTKRDRSTRDNTPTCKCKKTGCLKRYCRCFKNGYQCGDACACTGCANKDKHEIQVNAAPHNILPSTEETFNQTITYTTTQAPTILTGGVGGSKDIFGAIQDPRFQIFAPSGPSGSHGVDISTAYEIPQQSSVNGFGQPFSSNEEGFNKTVTYTNEEAPNIFMGGVGGSKDIFGTIQDPRLQLFAPSKPSGSHGVDISTSYEIPQQSSGSGFGQPFSSNEEGFSKTVTYTNEEAPNIFMGGVGDSTDTFAAIQDPIHQLIGSLRPSVSHRVDITPTNEISQQSSGDGSGQPFLDEELLRLLLLPSPRNASLIFKSDLVRLESGD